MPKPTPVRLGPVLLRPMAIKGDHARWRAEWYPPGSNGKMRTRSLSRKRGERISEDEAVGRAIELMAAGEHLVSVDADGTPNTRVETVLDLLEVWLGFQQTRVGSEIRESTWTSYKARCRTLARDPLADTQLVRVDQAAALAFLKRLKSQGEDRSVTTLLMVFRAAWNWGLRHDPPLVPAPFPTLRWKSDPRPQHIPTGDDVEATLTALAELRDSGTLRPSRIGQCIALLEILWGTGARPGELAASNACDFDLHANVWRVRAVDGAKTGRRLVPLSTSMQQYISSYLDGRTDGPMFAPVVKELGNRANAWVVRGAAIAGVPKWTCKGLRHLAITNMLTAGVEVQTVASIVGNSPQTIWSTYAHVLAGRPEQSVEVIGRRASEGRVIPLRRRG